jgi:hypothetical protein
MNPPYAVRTWHYLRLALVDPYVLSSCGPDGYTVTATVDWTIVYTASGPVARGGSLPARTTATSIIYPVSEARGFLTKGGSS